MCVGVIVFSCKGKGIFVIELRVMSSVVELYQSVRGKKCAFEMLPNKAVELAKIILEQSNEGMLRGERVQAAKLARMMTDAPGKALTLVMADQVFRPLTYEGSAARFRDLVASYGVPKYLAGWEAFAMALGAKASEYLPGVVMPLVTRQLREESSKVILPSEDAKLKPHLRERKASGMRMNINQLGEAILGEEEARHRLAQVIDRLKTPECEYISVKISAIMSQINLIDFEGTVRLIQERLRVLYRVAMESHPHKFVNLDMEEYRDLHLTCEAFMRTLMESEFLGLEGGIVLQAYLPDAFLEQQKLTEWAKERVAAGGARIKIRIVKGANLAMEKVEASLHDWPLAPYGSKADVDANYKRMVQFGCLPENAKFVRIGLASHNLFDLSYGMLLREYYGVNEDLEFEMLEGMANHQARVVNSIAEGLLLYAPVVKREDFHSAIAYLVRRLDENTSEENFLHDLFGMTYGSREWEIQRHRFLRACNDVDVTKLGPSRTQNRATQEFVLKEKEGFRNAQDTDWALRANQAWAAEKVGAFSAASFPEIPLVINGEDRMTQLIGVGRDPSRSGAKSYTFCYADHAFVREALQAAVDAQPEWAKTTIEERRRLLKNVAIHMEKKRGEALAVMLLDGAKSLAEADGELSEAIDFANYYAEGLGFAGMFDGTELAPLGTVVIAPPWNFPFAIPAGGALAALMAGNTVIFKPSTETVLTSWVMINCLWDAGIPKKALQFVATLDNEIGQELLTDSRVDGVILTGAWDTARMFQEWRPSMRLFAETSGKNALIITENADPDQAVKDLVKSAFGHAGQKCSAASLGLISSAVYHNAGFRKQLKDAASSLKVGSAWDLSSVITPLINEPGKALMRALTSLEVGEEWLLEPKMVDGNPYLWSPGIKLGVKPNSWFHKTECFGPVLGLMEVASLEEAIALQNSSEFGLTGGIHTLDDKEIELWKSSVEVGNAYVNRPITGAIVRRQPFGGWKKSCFGPGAKAGGPNYVAQFGVWTEKSQPSEGVLVKGDVATLLNSVCSAMKDDSQRLRSAAASQFKWYIQEFSVEHDPSQVYGENNRFRYVPVKRVLLRADGVSDSDIAIACLAAMVAHVPLDVSITEKRPWMDLVPELSLVEESEEGLIARLAQEGKKYNYLRIMGGSESVYVAANAVSLPIIDQPILANGRLELVNYYREQAISETIHRYGNIIPKPAELGIVPKAVKSKNLKEV